VPEGETVFANEPLLRVTAPLIEAQLAETFLLNAITFQTTIATKAARIALACSDRSFVDFSGRRDHGADAAIRYYNSPESTMASTYGVIIETDTGIILAHPWRPQSIGVAGSSTAIDVLHTQPGDGGEWRSYAHENPVDGARQLKHSWFVDHDGHTFVSGWYEAINPVG